MQAPIFPLSVNQNQWRLIDAPLDGVEELLRRHNLPDIVARLMVGRGLSTDTSDIWLRPTLKATMKDPPMTLKEMNTAAKRLARAILDQEHIGVFGDYDVDGATSTALMVRYLRYFGLDPSYHIPDRKTEGYGPNAPALSKMAEQGASLLLTLDCGASAEAVFSKLSESSGFSADIIVLDHHGVETLPTTPLAHVNPNRIDDESIYGDLAAVGVVFLTLIATNSVLRSENVSTELPDPMQWLDLVALGTVCDVVPLRGLNRAIVWRGLRQMARKPNTGLSALMDQTNIHRPDIEVDTSLIGFKIGPLLNAAGRVGNSRLATDLLLTSDATHAAQLAAHLAELNSLRRDVQSAVEIEARDAIGHLPEDEPLALAIGENWASGILGIVAGKICERMGRPAIVLSRSDDELYQGSGRSIEGIDLGRAVRDAAEQGLIVRGGGHARAVGLALTQEQIPSATRYLKETIGAQWTEREHSTQTVDAILTPSGATLELLDSLTSMAPFGEGNPEPYFAILGVRPVGVRPVGTDHVRCTLQDGVGGRLSAIAFFCLNAPLGLALLSCQPLHLLGTLQKNNWRNNREVQFLIKDAIAL